MELESHNLDLPKEPSIQNNEDITNLLNQSSNIAINCSKSDINKQEKFDISSTQLENVVSNYTDLYNKMTLLESIELLGGTKGIIEKLNSSVDAGIINPSEERIKNFGINKIFEKNLLLRL